MSRTLYQVAFVGSMVIYVATHTFSWGNFFQAGEGGKGFEFSVAKQSDEAKQAQWQVKMSAGTFTMNFSWNP